MENTYLKKATKFEALKKGIKREWVSWRVTPFRWRSWEEKEIDLRQDLTIRAEAICHLVKFAFLHAGSPYTDYTDTQYSYHLHWYAEGCPGHRFRPPCGHSGCSGCSGLCPVCPCEVTPRRSIHWDEFHSVFKQPFKSLRPVPLSHHIKCPPVCHCSS